MPLAVVYRRQVGRDLAAGFDHYAAQAPGLGEKFLAAVTDVFEAIGRYPRMFAAVPRSGITRPQPPHQR